MHTRDIEESYKHLKRYLEGLKSTNPGSRSVLEVHKVGNSTKQFIFSFHGCIKGFENVRPMLFTNGTFLKGKYKGVLLSAVGNNGNQGLYPLAFAVVRGENIDNWGWFLEQLKITIGDERHMTFFSDRHVGLLDEYEVVAQDGGGRKVDKFLERCDPKKWAEAYCVKSRYGETTSNVVESFNNWVNDDRELPITDLIDKLRLKLMKLFDDRRTKAGVLCPFYQDKGDASVHNGLSILVARSNTLKYEMLTTPSECVDLVLRQCSSHEWKRTEFPCQHDVLCISKEKLPMKDYVEKWFHADVYRCSYDTAINPLPSSIWQNSTLINKSNITLPDTNWPPGRPQKKRILSGGEAVPIAKKKQAIQCGMCKNLQAIINERAKIRLLPKDYRK